LHHDLLKISCMGTSSENRVQFAQTIAQRNK
jgi:hypothetical protein